MKIGLMGFEFSSANKGCEALSYSFLEILNDIFQDNEYPIEIYNFTEYDLGLLPESYNKFDFYQIVPKLKDFSFTYLRMLKKCDFIFDITMGDSFSDIYSIKYYNSLMRNKRIASIFAGKYILLPQTYGPFNLAESRKKAQKVLKKSKKIYCRDELSQKLLEEKFNINDSQLVTDIAFFLPYDKSLYEFNTNNTKIGINVSGLLYKGGFNENNQFNLSIDYKQFINNILKYFEKLVYEGYEIYLIPHVIDLNKNSNDDDYKISKELIELYPSLKLAPIFENPIQAKSFISNMDIFIGSRMHSTIAAFSSGVLTIPISYSRKFEGLFNSFDYPYVINGRTESTSSGINKVIEYINKKEILQGKQKKSKEIIDSLSSEFKNSIKEILFNI
ncbi:polysaccharide pyruvyl transferase family protein [Thomasclavelia sp.]|uniref:polysaccharide pyruvyl transferase family protein n=1 Tax=Thomasclavelia sp. TaxID=3025757 RepID=UPI0025E970BA|nr:polysaccharide pyruvyl transferase family protein [Thomasclavelia sp.]